MLISSKPYLSFLFGIVFCFETVSNFLTPSEFSLRGRDYKEYKTIGDFCVKCIDSHQMPDTRKDIRMRFNFTATPFINLNFYGLKLKTKYVANGQFDNPVKDSFIWDYKIMDGYLFSVTLVDEDYHLKIISKREQNFTQSPNPNPIPNLNETSKLNQNSNLNQTSNINKTNNFSNLNQTNNSSSNVSIINPKVVLNNSIQILNEYDSYMAGQKENDFRDISKEFNSRLFINRESFHVYIKRKELEKLTNKVENAILPKYCLVKDLSKNERFLEIYISTTYEDTNNQINWDIKLYLDGKILDNKIFVSKFDSYLFPKEELSTIRVRAEMPYFSYLDDYIVNQFLTNIKLRSIAKYFYCPEELYYDVFTGVCLNKCDNSQNSTLKAANCICSKNYLDFVSCPLKIKKAPIFINKKNPILYESQICSQNVTKFDECKCSENSYYSEKFETCIACEGLSENNTCKSCRQNYFFNTKNDCVLCGNFCEFCGLDECAKCHKGYFKSSAAFCQIYGMENCESITNLHTDNHCNCFQGYIYDENLRICIIQNQKAQEVIQTPKKNEILDLRLFYGTCMDVLAESFPPQFCWKKDTDRVEIDPTSCPIGYQYRNNMGTGKGCVKPCTVFFPLETFVGLDQNCCQPKGNDYYSSNNNLKCKDYEIWRMHLGKCYIRDIFNFDSEMSKCPVGYYKDFWKCRPDCRQIGMTNCGLAACASDTGNCVGGVFEMIGETIANVFTAGTASSFKNYIKTQIKNFSKEKLKDILKNNINLIRNKPAFSKILSIAKAKITKKKKNNQLKNMITYFTDDYPENSCMQLYNEISNKNFNSFDYNPDVDDIINAFDVFNIKGMIDECTDTSEYNEKIRCARTVIEQAPVGIISLAAVFMKQTCESILDTPEVLEDQKKYSEVQAEFAQNHKCVLLYNDNDYLGSMEKMCGTSSSPKPYNVKSFRSFKAYGILFTGLNGDGDMFPFGGYDEENNMSKRVVTDKCGLPLSKRYYSTKSYLLIGKDSSFSDNWCFVYDYHDSKGNLYNRLLPTGNLINDNPIDSNVESVHLIIIARAYLSVNFQKNFLNGNKFIKSNFDVNFSMSFSYEAYRELIRSNPRYSCDDLKSYFINYNLHSLFMVLILLLILID